MGTKYTNKYKEANTTRQVSHPGIIIRDIFMPYHIEFDGYTLWDLASKLPLDKRLSLLLEGKVDVDERLDKILTNFFGVTAGFFLRMQRKYDRT